MSKTQAQLVDEARMRLDERVEGRWEDRAECSIDGCTAPYKCRGWCSAHYHRWQRYGDPLGGIHSTTARFWSKVEKTESCWEWVGGRTRGGYGACWANGKHTTAHRYAYELHNGPIPDGMFVCHTCDNRRCVNPSHLWLGTHQDNMNDMDSKGRRYVTRGIAHPLAKLSDQAALDIYEDPRKAHVIASEYGVSRELVSKIKCGRAWVHVTGAVRSD